MIQIGYHPVTVDNIFSDKLLALLPYD